MCLLSPSTFKLTSRCHHSGLLISYPSASGTPMFRDVTDETDEDYIDASHRPVVFMRVVPCRSFFICWFVQPMLYRHTNWASSWLKVWMFPTGSMDIGAKDASNNLKNTISRAAPKRTGSIRMSLECHSRLANPLWQTPTSTWDVTAHIHGFWSMKEFISPKGEHLSIRMRRLPAFTRQLYWHPSNSAKGQTHPLFHRLSRMYAGPCAETLRYRN